MSELHRLHALFDELLEVPPERRADWFAQQRLDDTTRAELERLARADRDSGGVLDRSIAGQVEALDAFDEDDFPDPIGRRIGPFRIVERIGEGGMATVFLAEREEADFEQRVALKLLRRDAFSSVDLALFRRERQVLAKLTHPNIARLIDGGVSDDGIPYLAMEYVDGVAITRWCRERALDLDARVALVAKVARAVAAAHQALVVHRDIKPSNVLVGADGEPKLLDFGIAKLLSAEGGETTRSGAAPMTPEYAAPEQFAGGDISTATDVYALGVLTYELVTGARPRRDAIRAPSTQLAQAAGTTAARRVRGDLDKVVLMALAEEPGRRYAGAAAFADDLERHLAHQPVVAHPPSRWYRTRKFMQRHRGGVALTVLLLIGMIVSLGFALVQANAARQEAKRANAVRDFLVEALGVSRADRPPEQRATLADLVVAARERIDADTTLDRATRAEVLHALGEVSAGAAEYDEARRLHERALAEREAISGIADERAIALRARLAELVSDTGDAPAALAILDAAPAEAYEREHESAVALGLTRAGARLLTGDREAALADIPRLVALAERVFGRDAKESLEVRISAGGIYAYAERDRDVVALLEPALTEWRARGLPETSMLGTALSNLAGSLSSVGRADDALARARESVALRRRIHQDPHDDLATSLSNLAVMLAGRGEFAEARKVHDEAIAIRRALFGPDSVRLLSSIAGIAEIERGERNFDAAIERLAEAERICSQPGNREHPLCAAILHNFAYVHYQAGRFDEAERVAQETRALRERTLGPDDPSMMRSWSLLATIANGAGRHAEAVERAERALAIAERSGQVDAESVVLTRLTRAEALLGLGRAREARDAIDALIPEWKRITSPTHYRLVQFLAMRAKASVALGEREAARADAVEALALATDPKLIRPATLEFLEKTARE